MGIGGRKDPRDKRRRQQNMRRKKGSRARCGTIAGRRGTVTAVRQEANKQGKVTTEVTEEAFDLPVPSGLGKVLKTLRIKVNWTKEVDGAWKGQEGVRSFVLSLVFRKTVEGGIAGLPVSSTKQRKLRKVTFDRVSIEKVSTNPMEDLSRSFALDFGYDERKWRINFWKEGRGKRRPGKRFGGRPVETITDELSVLEWILNNGLESLYDSLYLSSNRFLPKTDKQRAHTNAIVAQMQMIFGVNYAAHEDSTMHRVRLEHRFMQVHEGDELKVLNAMAKTAIGKQRIMAEMQGTLAEQKFYFSRSLGLAYALYNLPNARYVVRVDFGKETVVIEPLRINREGEPMMKRYQNFLESTFFEKIDSRAFQGLTHGVGRIKIVVD